MERLADDCSFSQPQIVKQDLGLPTTSNVLFVLIFKTRGGIVAMFPKAVREDELTELINARLIKFREEIERNVRQIILANIKTSPSIEEILGQLQTSIDIQAKIDGFIKARVVDNEYVKTLIAVMTGSAMVEAEILSRVRKELDVATGEVHKAVVQYFNVKSLELEEDWPKKIKEEMLRQAPALASDAVKDAIEKRTEISTSLANRFQSIFNETDAPAQGIIRGAIEAAVARHVSNDTNQAEITAAFNRFASQHMERLAAAQLERSRVKINDLRPEPDELREWLNRWCAATVPDLAAPRVNAFVLDALQKIDLNEIIRPLVGPAVTGILSEQQFHAKMWEIVEASVGGMIDRNYDKLFRRVMVVPDQRTPLEHRPALTWKHFQYETVFKALSSGANVMMVGPTGCGKSTIAQQIADSMGTKFRFNGSIQSEYKLLGFQDAAGRFQETPFYDAFTKGGVYLFDEIDASSASALVAFSAALANGMSDFPGHADPVKMHQGFRCIAAANTYGRGQNRQYVGRQQLDAATLDRFIVIEIKYDNEMENLMFQEDGATLEWVAKAHSWRSAIIELGDVRHFISTRSVVNGARLLKLGFDQDEVEHMAVWKGLDSGTVQRVKTAASGIKEA